MPTTTQNYPQAGTNADRILEYVREHPQTSKNGIIEGLKLNPGVVRKCVAALEEKGLLVDAPDDRRVHHYTAKVPKL